MRKNQPLVQRLIFINTVIQFSLALMFFWYGLSLALPPEQASHFPVFQKPR